jgi:hypothetical protein
MLKGGLEISPTGRKLGEVKSWKGETRRGICRRICSPAQSIESFQQIIELKINSGFSAVTLFQ